MRTTDPVARVLELEADLAAVRTENATLRHFTPDAERLLAIHRPYTPGDAVKMLDNEFQSYSMDDTELMGLRGLLEEALRDERYPLLTRIRALEAAMPDPGTLEHIAAWLGDDHNADGTDARGWLRDAAAAIRALGTGGETGAVWPEPGAPAPAEKPPLGAGRIMPPVWTWEAPTEAGEYWAVLATNAPPFRIKVWRDPETGKLYGPMAILYGPSVAPPPGWEAALQVMQQEATDGD